MNEIRCPNCEELAEIKEDEISTCPNCDCRLND
jgi:ssDNA-binding Zn-finger/Zn-ribbon topoisomerase 1